MHFISKKILTTVARLLLAVLLFAQYSLATQACMLPESAPAMAFASDAMPGCEMHTTDQHNPNACFVHCTSNYQALDSHHASADLGTVLLPTPLVISSQPKIAIVQSSPSILLARVVGPPPYLLHQNFRI